MKSIAVSIEWFIIKITLLGLQRKQTLKKVKDLTIPRNQESNRGQLSESIWEMHLGENLSESHLDFDLQLWVFLILFQLTLVNNIVVGNPRISKTNFSSFFFLFV